MTEDPIIIRMNIAHYQAMLQVSTDGEKRSSIERLLAKARADLMLTTNSRK